MLVQRCRRLPFLNPTCFLLTCAPGGGAAHVANESCRCPQALGHSCSLGLFMPLRSRRRGAARVQRERWRRRQPWPMGGHRRSAAAAPPQRRHCTHPRHRRPGTQSRTPSPTPVLSRRHTPPAAAWHRHRRSHNRAYARCSRLELPRSPRACEQRVAAAVASPVHATHTTRRGGRVTASICRLLGATPR